MAVGGKKRGPRPGHRGGGRKKGTPNKLTRSIRQVFEDAFIEAQKDKTTCLPNWIKTHTTEFYRLMASILPRQLVGVGDGPIQVAGVVSVYMPDNNRRNDGAPLLAQATGTKRLFIKPRSSRPGAAVGGS